MTDSAGKDCRLQAYKDSDGVWRIGYGHTGLNIHQGQVISPEQAESLRAKQDGA